MSKNNWRQQVGLRLLLAALLEPKPKPKNPPPPKGEEEK